MTPGFVETFELSEKRAFDGQPLRFTGAGIWLPLPLDIVASFIATLRRAEVWSRLGPRPKVLDAGAGDGRLVAGLCAAATEVRVFGIEHDENLARLAEDNLRRLTALGLPARWTTCEGDYLSLSTYEELGLGFADVDLFLNYPDGSEHALASLIAEHGRPGARLALVTPDHTLRVDALELEEELQIERPSGAPSFRLVLHRAP